MSLRLYRGASRVAAGLPLRHGRLAESLAGRRGAADRWRAWAGEHPAAGPRIWVHAASVGEARALRPVLARLRRARADGLEIVHTFTSPSVTRWPGLLPAARSDYLPLDTPADVGAALDGLAPDCLVLGRGDIWPELLVQAARRQIPVAVVGATTRARRLRRARPVRSLYARALASVSWIGAVTPQDAERWRRTGARPEIVEITGDPRHDAVLEQLTDLRAIHSLLPWGAGADVLVAGSVEPADEAPLLAAATSVLRTVPDARMLVVPHDADAAAEHRLMARAARAGLEAAAWSAGEAPPTARCVVVRGTGLLYHLYALGTLAYVGGGFSRGKLHAVIEPAAYGQPIITGPHVTGTADAEALAAGGALVPARRHGAAASIATAWLRWLREIPSRTAAGLAARRSLHEGAATRSAEALGALLAAARPHMRRGAPNTARSASR